MCKKGISEWIKGWKARGWMTAGKTPVKNADLWKALDSVAQLHEVEWLWVKGMPAIPKTSAPMNSHVAARMKRASAARQWRHERHVRNTADRAGYRDHGS